MFGQSAPIDPDGLSDDPGTTTESGADGSAADDEPNVPGDGTDTGTSDDAGDGSVPEPDDDGDDDDGDDDDDDDDAADTGESGTVDEGVWAESCRSDAASGACPVPVGSTVACVSPPTQPMPTGCGDGAEHRVTLSVDLAGDYVIGLVDPSGATPAPDARLGVVGVDGVRASCIEPAAPTVGPVVELPLAEGMYDAIITTGGSGVAAPFVVRSVDTLCTVDDSCCDPEPGPCSDDGLTGCVGGLDPYCVEQDWDAACVHLAVIACGAACEVP